ncbi:MAG: hypothetical protein ACYDHY_18280 [Acidiferrobacterales bacterium]
MPYDPNIDGPADALGMKAAAASIRDSNIARNIRNAERQHANRVVAEWEQEVERWKQAYAKLEQSYYMELDAHGAWREIAIEQAEESRGSKFPQKGNPARDTDPLIIKYRKIYNRKTASRAAGKPEEC